MLYGWTISSPLVFHPRPSGDWIRSGVSMALSSPQGPQLFALLGGVTLGHPFFHRGKRSTRLERTVVGIPLTTATLSQTVVFDGPRVTVEWLDKY